MKPLSAGGMSGTAVINGRTFTSRQCFQNALSFNENDGTTWFHLGCGLTSGETARHNKRRFTKLQCLVNAIQFGPGLSLLVRSMGHRVDPKRSDIWCAIGKEVPDGDTVLVDGNALLNSGFISKAGGRWECPKLNCLLQNRIDERTSSQGGLALPWICAIQKGVSMFLVRNRLLPNLWKHPTRG